MSSIGPGKSLVVVGASHRTAEIAAREAVGVPKERLASALAEWKALPDVEGICVVSTCNRTEVLASGADAEALERAVRDAAFRKLPIECVYAFRDAEAICHAFSVVSGLRSMVLGESEIQAQWKEAAQAARDAACVDAALDAVLQQALRVGKRVRTETALGMGTLSVASAALELAERVLGDLTRRSALIVGAGETGRLAARRLRDRGLSRLTFSNRTAERAAAAALEFGASAAPFETLAKSVADHDVVVACVEAAEPILDATSLKAFDWPSSDAPKVFLDLSSPRALHPSINGFRGAFLFDLDAVEGVVASHREARRAEIERADRIIVDETAKFLAFRTYATLSPAMAALRDRFEEARDAWVGSRGGAATDLDEATRDLSKRLLAVALAHFKDATRLTQSRDELERTYRRYVERVG